MSYFFLVDFFFKNPSGGKLHTNKFLLQIKRNQTNLLRYKKLLTVQIKYGF